MFNLLRMDLYRVRKSKSVYICFGILLAATAASRDAYGSRNGRIV